MNPATLALLGQALLANVVADLSAAGLTVPTRQVFAHGLPVYDGNCGLVAVWIDHIDTGSGGDTTPRPQQGPTNRGVTHIVTWGVDVNVCAAERTATPTAAQVTADGILGATWLWALHRSLTNRWVNSRVFEPYVTATQLPGGKGLTVSGGGTPEVQAGLIVARARLAVNVRDIIP